MEGPHTHKAINSSLHMESTQYMLTLLIYYTTHLTHLSGITVSVTRGRQFLFCPFGLWLLQILIRYKPCCCSRLFFLMSLQLPATDTSLLTLVGVGKMLWSGLCSKNICGRPLWLALLLYLMHCTWAVKHVWKEVILVWKTDDLKLAFILLWIRGIPAKVLKSCHQIFADILPVTPRVLFILSAPSSCPGTLMRI